MLICGQTYCQFEQTDIEYIIYSEIIPLNMRLSEKARFALIKQKIIIFIYGRSKIGYN